MRKENRYLHYSVSLHKGRGTSGQGFVKDTPYKYTTFVAILPQMHKLVHDLLG